MKKTLLILAMLALPASAMAQGLIGDCADCHTMHNSEQGQAVAVSFPDGFGSPSVTGHTFPIQNLLRMDCIACHAQNTGDNIVNMGGGSAIPQVLHTNANDLAGGNFSYVMTNDRKGHNVIDLMAADVANSSNPNAGTPGATLAPGDIRNDAGGHDFSNFTCAGAKGCHGTRSQALTSTFDPGGNIVTERVGLAALSGAHHNSYDGDKSTVAQITVGTHDGQQIADSYRFLRGLKGWGFEPVNLANRWQNLDADRHNEYYGQPGGIDTTLGGGCNRCHVPGAAETGRSARFAQDSTIKIPNQSMSGFCSTCHGNFHSAGGVGPNADMVGAGYGGNNGVSGAFLRHPSDYVIPGGTTEYAAYTVYDITAPVARQTLAAPTSTVTPGSDMVMCLSCHVAHGSDYEGMLRFDYSAMTAGFYGTTVLAQDAGGCLACHTTKGVLPENR